MVTSHESGTICKAGAEGNLWGHGVALYLVEDDGMNPTWCRGRYVQTNNNNGNNTYCMVSVSYNVSFIVAGFWINIILHITFCSPLLIFFHCGWSSSISDCCVFECIISLCISQKVDIIHWLCNITPNIGISHIVLLWYQHTDCPSLIAKAILSSLHGAYCYVSVLDSSMQYCSVALRQHSNIETNLRKAKRSFVHCSKIATGCGDRHAGTSLPRLCTPLECILLEGPFIRQSTVRRVTVCRFR